MQRVWSIGEIGRIAETLAVVGPTPDFAAGVLALAHALNAPVQLPKPNDIAAMTIVIDSSLEATR
jgi:hypothetical protein